MTDRTARNELKQFMAGIDELEFMLRHKESKDHLPRPMISTFDLDHYWCRPRKACKICKGEEEVDIEEAEGYSGQVKRHNCLLDVNLFSLDSTNDFSNADPEPDEADEEDEIDGIRVLPDIMNDSDNDKLLRYQAVRLLRSKK